jgi:hypothetical protein
MIDSGLKIRLKSLGIYVLGLGIFALLLMLPLVMFWGVAAVSAFLYPLFSILAGISIIAFILFILPLSLIENLRMRLAVISVILSYVCGAAVWMYSFLTLIGFLGWWAVFLVFLFRFLAPLAIISLFVKGQLVSGLTLITGLVFTYGMRFYGFWLEELYNREAGKDSDLIDTEARILE